MLPSANLKNVLLCDVVEQEDLLPCVLLLLEYFVTAELVLQVAIFQNLWVPYRLQTQDPVEDRF